MKVAVYGSLKRGYGNHRVMKNANGKYLYDAVSTDAHYILDGHSYPYINEAPSNPEKGKLSVEIYEVSEEGLLHLDALEGHPTFYKREQRQFSTPTGKVTAWLYILQRKIEANPVYKQDGVYIW